MGFTFPLIQAAEVLYRSPSLARPRRLPISEPDPNFVCRPLLQLDHTTGGTGRKRLDLTGAAPLQYAKCDLRKGAKNMARVPYVKRDDLDTEGQQIYDSIRLDRDRPEVGLQYQALLHNPKATGYLASLGTQLRIQSALPEHLKELAIILVAREWNSAIEWTGHAPSAIRAGISPASVEAIRGGEAPAGLTEPEQVITRFVHQLLRQKEISDDVFAAAQTLLGTRGIVDLTFTCIFFTALSLGQIALKPEIRPGKVSTL